MYLDYVRDRSTLVKLLNMYTDKNSCLLLNTEASPHVPDGVMDVKGPSHLLVEVVEVTVAVFDRPLVLSICHLHDINLEKQKPSWIRNSWD